MRFQCGEDLYEKRAARRAGPILLLAIGSTSLMAEQVPRPATRGDQPEVQGRHEGALSIDGHAVTQVEVRLARGSLMVKGSDRPDLHLRTVQRSSSIDPRVVVMRTSQANGVVRVVAYHPATHVGPPVECLPVDEELGDFWHIDVTVDVELSIPRRMNLKLRTMRGDAEVSGLAGTLDVATNDGGIRLKGLGGELTAAALGSVDLRMDSSPGSGTHARRVSAYRGDVRLWIPHNESLQIGRAGALVAPADELELARTEGSESLSLPVLIGQSSPPIQVELTRGRLILMPSHSSWTRQRP